MKPPHGRLTVEPAALALTYHWLCVGCCDYAEASDEQRKKEAKP